MIRIETDRCVTHVLQPTIFPDGTSQVWKLPQDVLDSHILNVTWNFESEREILDLLSLRMLMPPCILNLRIPYLPYGRQDKQVGNQSTFNLRVFAELINNLIPNSVISVDTHNPAETASLIHRFSNVEVTDIHKHLIDKLQPTYVVFPDAGAETRYNVNLGVPSVICSKVRDQLTGNITGHDVPCPGIKPGDKFLIIDDICDGGATFISIAKKLRSLQTDIKIDLFVTHGIFSKGKDILITNGINEVYTTNSLIKNGEGFKV